ncbi:hypothetical protein HIM_06307 [Hirsutella minnesotensis 3608]|uniref:Zn(2)-C6 fungal-type domain-containing protein n=1 Tax=Hirsutella minnesotensis 3608 TaxID=1043627 RepID=A0A0F7ZJD3_9HYPO|nr:hypothetical protein HIM_06307 [Hirsutella minnesotensis 3608]
MDRESSSQTPSGPSQSSTGNTPQNTAPNSNPPGPSQTTPAAAAASTPSVTVSTSNSKRRRGLGVVTPNACTECRKKRAKCDGQKPCGRCKSQKDVDCVYEIPVRQSKENLRNEIEGLRSRQRSSDVVFAALVRPDLWEEVLRRLRSGHAVENISEWLSGAVSTRPSLSAPGDHEPGSSSVLRLGAITSSNTTTPSTATFPPGSAGGALDVSGKNISPLTAHPPQVLGDLSHNSPWHFSSQSQAGSARSNSHSDVSSWAHDLRGPPHVRVGSWAEGMPHRDRTTDGLPRYRGLEQVLSPLSEPNSRTQTSAWTNITKDINLVQHLLALYFCWEYPTFASLSKEHFLQDFQSGRHRYCSPILVNALLALGCRFSTHPMTRANPANPYTSGDHFFKESQRLLNQETDHHTLTTIQALGIMSIREASCGRDSESWYYAGQSIRLAIEMGLNRVHDDHDEDEHAVRSATFWGAFALDHAWSLATGSLPQCSAFPHLPHKPAIIGDIEASLWVPYTDDGAPLQRSCEQPSNVRSVYKCFCELSELVHQSLYVLHSPGKLLTARDLLGIYTQYLNWYDQIPEVLRLGHNFTPAVLFAHMYYHFAILLLFRPLIKLRIVESKVMPRDVCSQAADAIQGLLTSYSQLYTLQRTPSFVPYFVLTSAIVHLAIGASSVQSDNSNGPDQTQSAAIRDPRISEALNQGISDLTQMAPCHHFAEQALNILRYLANKWRIDVEIEDRSDSASSDQDKMDQDTPNKPYTSSLNFFAPNFRSGDFICRWGPGKIIDDGSPEVTPKSACHMENPLFWPFPLQGRPVLPSGKELEEAGFALL